MKTWTMRFLTGLCAVSYTLLASCNRSPSPIPTETSRQWTPSPGSEVASTSTATTPEPPPLVSTATAHPSFLPPSGNFEALSSEQIRDLATLTDTPNCRLPCWNDLVVSKSSVQDISTLFASLSFDPSKIPIRDLLDRIASGPLRFAEVEVVSSPAFTPDLGLDWVTVFWGGSSEKTQAIQLSYSHPPEGLDAQTLFSKFGDPASAFIAGEPDGSYRLLFAFTSTSALLRLDVVPVDSTHLCLGNDQLREMEVLFVSPANDPLAFTDVVAEPLREFEDQSYFTSISDEEFFHQIATAEGCVNLVHR